MRLGWALLAAVFKDGVGEPPGAQDDELLRNARAVVNYRKGVVLDIPTIQAADAGLSYQVPWPAAEEVLVLTLQSGTRMRWDACVSGALRRAVVPCEVMRGRAAAPSWLGSSCQADRLDRVAGAGDQAIWVVARRRPVARGERQAGA